jgi:hypothetical protein
MRLRTKLALTMLVTSTAASGCSSSEPTAYTSAALSTTPRIWLTSTLLARLKQRANGGDASWTALRSHCDALSTGTVELPNGNAYPNAPSVGQGYQGDGYLPEVLALGLCYQTMTGIDDMAAANWAATGASVLAAMSTPVANGGATPSTDDGYGIRNYGVGMALGYDWLRPALDATTRTAVQTALDAWIAWFDASGFSKDEPIGNYFAGYLFAKTAAAIALDGDDANAPTWWTDVQTRMWPTLVQPAFGTSLSGGGWPEGWEYGPRAVENMVGFLWAVNTGESLGWWTQLPLARDEAQYIAQFSWPSRKHIDDRGMIHSGSNLAPSASAESMLATVLDQQGDAFAAAAHGAAADLLSATGETIPPWSAFLFWDPAAAQTPVSALPTSYLAPGPGHVAMRSSWANDATWASFVSGAYIDAPDSGEQFFDEGSVAIAIGDTPVLINATGWLPQAAGDPGETFVYDDTWGSETRLLDNVFYASGAIQRTIPPAQASTHLEHYEDGGAFMHARGRAIEQMYSPSGVVTQFLRDVAYVRPGTFVVYDRTTVTNGASDQWTAWHVPGTPSQTTAADGTPVFGVTTGGAVHALLPTAATVATTALLGVATRIEVHSSAASQDWLTVVNAGETPNVERLSVADGNVTSGAVLGAHTLGATRESVVLFATDHAANVPCTGADYLVTQAVDADHVVFDVAPSATGYAVTATPTNGKLAIHIAAGGSFQPTPQGTLAFVVSSGGTVTAASWPQLTPWELELGSTVAWP